MGDPFSAVLQLSEKLIRYLRCAHGAPTESERLRQEIVDISKLVQSLENLSGQADASPSRLEMLKEISADNGPLRRIRERFEDLATELEKHPIESVTGRLV